MNILFWYLINNTIISEILLHCFIYAKYMTSYVCLQSSTISVSTDCILCLDNDYHAGHTKYQEIRLYRIIEIDEICHCNFSYARFRTTGRNADDTDVSNTISWYSLGLDERIWCVWKPSARGKVTTNFLKKKMKRYELLQILNSQRNFLRKFFS